MLSDEGSGYDLGLRALKLACRMYDSGESEDSTFTDAIFRHYALSSPGVLGRFGSLLTEAIHSAAQQELTDLSKEIRTSEKLIYLSRTSSLIG